MNQSYSDAWHWAIARLRDGGSEEPEAEIRAIFRDLWEIGYAQILSAPSQTLTDDQQESLVAIIMGRRAHIPLQYLLGQAHFLDFTVQVAPEVLIPRPETETLVMEARRVCPHAQRIVDVGVGSGVIAIAIARLLPEAEVWGVDISPAALAIAAKNVASHGLSDRVHLLLGDCLTPVEALAPFDLIISNPPYITPLLKKTLSPEVLEYEPHLALFAEGDGLGFYRNFAMTAPILLNDRGALAVEVGLEQATAVAELFQAVFPSLQVLHDLSGIPRVVIGQKS